MRLHLSISKRYEGPTCCIEWHWTLECDGTDTQAFLDSSFDGRDTEPELAARQAPPTPPRSCNWEFFFPTDILFHSLKSKISPPFIWWPLAIRDLRTTLACACSSPSVDHCGLDEGTCKICNVILVRSTTGAELLTSMSNMGLASELEDFWLFNLLPGFLCEIRILTANCFLDFQRECCFKMSFFLSENDLCYHKVICAIRKLFSSYGLHGLFSFIFSW